MHELGIVFHLRDLLEDVAGEQGLTHIAKVNVDLGEVSGVMTDLFEEAWRWTADKTDLLRGSDLDITCIEAVTVCNDCGKTYRTVEHGRTCPHCSSPHTELLRGKELEVREIEAY